jgi:hypothetical protein
MKNKKGKKAKKKNKKSDEITGWLDDVYDILTGYLIFIVKKIQTIVRRRTRGGR